MMHLLHDHWVLICGIGIIVNCYILFRAIEKEPNGAMGLGPLLLAVFIPFIFPVMFVIGYIVGLFTGE